MPAVNLVETTFDVAIREHASPEQREEYHRASHVRTPSRERRSEPPVQVKQSQSQWQSQSRSYPVVASSGSSDEADKHLDSFARDGQGY